MALMAANVALKAKLQLKGAHKPWKVVRGKEFLRGPFTIEFYYRDSMQKISCWDSFQCDQTSGCFSHPGTAPARTARLVRQHHCHALSKNAISSTHTLWGPYTLRGARIH